MYTDILHILVNKDMLIINLTKQGATPLIYSGSYPFQQSVYESLIKELENLHTHNPNSNKKATQLGAYIYQLLFSEFIKNKYDFFQEDKPLFLHIHNQLHKLPIEAAYNQQVFLGIQRCLIRIPHTQNTHKHSQAIQPPQSMIVIADPQNNLEHAYEEGKTIFDMIHNSQCIQRIDFISYNISTLDFLNILESYDALHFTGHSHTINTKITLYINEQKSVTQDDLKTIKHFPSFAFFNSCASSTLIFTQKLLTMDNHPCTLICTHHKTQDHKNHKTGIKEFYNQLLKGNTAAHAFHALRKHYYKRNLIEWMNYCLFGNPNFKLT